MAEPKWGFHVTIQHGILTGIKACVGMECFAAQIWVGNNKSFHSKIIPAAECEIVREYIADVGFFLIAHSPYILNFARPLSAGLRRIRSQDDNTQLEDDPKPCPALARYLRDLENVAALGGKGCVLHLGSCVDGISSGEAQQNFVDNLWWIAERKPKDTFIILENMAGGGKQMGKTLAEIASFWNDYFDPELKKHVRWCIDTAHLFAAGEYNISDPKRVNDFYNDWDQTIGWDHVLVIHFNGSKSKFSSKKDQHADIGSDHCGEIAAAGLREFARIASKTGKAVILETPVDRVGLEDQLETLASWISKD